jgi:hypothetical protein
MVNNKHAVWAPVIAEVYQHTGVVGIVFDAVVSSSASSYAKAPEDKKVTADREVPVQEKSLPTERKPIASPSPVTSRFAPTYTSKSAYQSRPKAIVEKSIDVSDTKKWPLTNRVLNFFPGTVTVVNNEARP